MPKTYHKSKNPIYQTNDISNFMFTRENIEKLIIKPINENLDNKKKSTKSEKIIPKKSIQSDFIIPKYNDKLFWCWMIFYYGIADYELTQNHNWQRESLEKIKIVETIRKYKQILKELKIKKNKLEEELVTDSSISVDAIIVLCAIHNFNFVYIKNKFYYKYESKNPSKTLIIKDDDGEAKIYIGDNSNEYLMKCMNLWRIYNLKKPLKALTVYKLKELQTICKILNLPTHNSNGKKKTKKVMYHSILNEI
jgi:hypothetical protein|tara:strand:- start:693 stop:1445 length:753 start_codon:yes stop_codon:yes gene_type:complete